MVTRSPLTPRSRAQSPTLDVALLTAGASRRLGKPKQHLDFGGRSLLVRAVTLAEHFIQSTSGQRPPLVISGAYLQDDCLALQSAGLSSRVRHHFNHLWTDGLPSSVALAGRLCKSAGLLVMLVDQYRISLDDLNLLHHTWLSDTTRPAAAGFAGTLGPPLIWPAALLATSEHLDKRGLTASDPRRVALPCASFDLDNDHDEGVASEYFRQQSQPPGLES